MPKTKLLPLDVRDKAIHIALALVRKYGYERFRLNDVAKELDISHAALYKYFNSKEDLLDSITAQWLKNIENGLQDIVNSELEIQERMIRWSVYLYRMKREKVLSDVEPYEAFLDSTKMNRPYIIDHVQISHKQFQTMVEIAINQQKFKGEPNEITSLILSSVVMFHHPALVFQHAHSDRTHELEHLLKVIFVGLSASKRM